jgi:hypothetical protein
LAPISSSTVTTPAPSIRAVAPEPVETLVAAPESSPAPLPRPVRTVEADPDPEPGAPEPVAQEAPTPVAVSRPVEPEAVETVEAPSLPQPRPELAEAQAEPTPEQPEAEAEGIPETEVSTTAVNQTEAAETASAETQGQGRENVEAASTAPEADVDAAPEPQGPKLNIAERNAIRQAVGKYYTFAGDRSDRQMSVMMRVTLDTAGQLTGQPEMLSARGGSRSAQRALFTAGAQAIRKAAAAGEFASLPPEKHGHWGVMVIRLGIDAFGVTS